jgi:hypothetical protein
MRLAELMLLKSTNNYPIATHLPSSVMCWLPSGVAVDGVPWRLEVDVFSPEG